MSRLQGELGLKTFTVCKNWSVSVGKLVTVSKLWAACARAKTLLLFYYSFNVVPRRFTLLD